MLSNAISFIIRGLYINTQKKPKTKIYRIQVSYIAKYFPRLLRINTETGHCLCRRTRVCGFQSLYTPQV